MIPSICTQHRLAREKTYLSVQSQNPLESQIPHEPTAHQLLNPNRKEPGGATYTGEAPMHGCSPLPDLGRTLVSRHSPRIPEQSPVIRVEMTPPESDQRVKGLTPLQTERGRWKTGVLLDTQTRKGNTVCGTRVGEPDGQGGRARGRRQGGLEKSQGHECSIIVVRFFVSVSLFHVSLSVSLFFDLHEKCVLSLAPFVCLLLIPLCACVCHRRCLAVSPVSPKPVLLHLGCLFLCPSVIVLCVLPCHALYCSAQSF